jgi:hypothetical protein
MMKQVDAPGVVLMANAYSPASTYAYALRRYVPVFGVGKFHARQDDLLVDYRTYQGQTIRIIRTELPKLDEYRPYFDTVELLTYQQSGITFYAVEGKGFHYEAYRDGPLTDVLNRYYRIPDGLPLAACPYCERVCGKTRCPLAVPASSDKADREADGP